MTTTVPTIAPKGAEQPLLDQVRAFIAEHPDLALRFRDMVTTYVRDADYPELQVEQITDDGETYPGMRCPWCQVDIANAAELAALDENDRATTFTADDFDWDRHSISTDYDGRGQFDAITYVHLECYRPVALPDGWREQ